MTPEHVTLIRQSWQQVTPIADTAAGLFYDRLFEIAPDTAKLFAGVDMDGQKSKLVSALSLVVAKADRIDELIPVLQELGRRHANYGVRDGHYDSVGSALIWTLEQGLGETFGAETRAAWMIAYATVAGVMREAASTTEAAA